MSGTGKINAFVAIGTSLVGEVTFHGKLTGKNNKDEQIERLQEQLADANKTIDYYDKKDFHYTLADGTVMGAEPAHKYKIKWGVK